MTVPAALPTTVPAGTTAQTRTGGHYVAVSVAVRDDTFAPPIYHGLWVEKFSAGVTVSAIASNLIDWGPLLTALPAAPTQHTWPPDAEAESDLPPPCRYCGGNLCLKPVCAEADAIWRDMVKTGGVFDEARPEALRMAERRIHAKKGGV